MINRIASTAKLPLGIQSFAEVRKLNYIYVNKTLLAAPSTP